MASSLLQFVCFSASSSSAVRFGCYCVWCNGVPTVDDDVQSWCCFHYCLRSIAKQLFQRTIISTAAAAAVAAVLIWRYRRIGSHTPSNHSTQPDASKQSAGIEEGTQSLTRFLSTNFISVLLFLSPSPSLSFSPFRFTYFFRFCSFHVVSISTYACDRHEVWRAKGTRERKKLNSRSANGNAPPTPCPTKTQSSWTDPKPKWKTKIGTNRRRQEEEGGGKGNAWDNYRVMHRRVMLLTQQKTDRNIDNSNGIWQRKAQLFENWNNSPFYQFRPIKIRRPHNYHSNYCIAYFIFVVRCGV